MAEAMIVMLIVSVALAASAPMLSKKAKSASEANVAMDLVNNRINYLFKLLGETPSNASEPLKTVPEALAELEVDGGGGDSSLTDLGTCRIGFSASRRSVYDKTFSNVSRSFCENLYLTAVIPVAYSATSGSTPQTTACPSLGQSTTNLTNTDYCNLSSYSFTKTSK